MINDRLFAAYMLMLLILLVGATVAFSIWVFIDAGLRGAAAVIPLWLIVTPPIAWLVWDMIHTFAANDVLWENRRG